jgi:hypothetical protein
MRHSPLQHGLMQATHNTLGLGRWSTVSYLFRDRPATGTVPGYLPPADAPDSHSSLGWCTAYNSYHFFRYQVLKEVILFSLRGKYLATSATTVNVCRGSPIKKIAENRTKTLERSIITTTKLVLIRLSSFNSNYWM